jgi:hypothetical protein
MATKVAKLAIACALCLGIVTGIVLAVQRLLAS